MYFSTTVPIRRLGLIGVDGVLAWSSSGIISFYGMALNEGDRDIQLGVHTAKEYNTCMKSRT